jgi:hypothetical protein
VFEGNARLNYRRIQAMFSKFVHAKSTRKKAVFIRTGFDLDDECSL